MSPIDWVIVNTHSYSTLTSRDKNKFYVPVERLLNEWYQRFPVRVWHLFDKVNKFDTPIWDKTTVGCSINVLVLLNGPMYYLEYADLCYLFVHNKAGHVFIVNPDCYCYTHTEGSGLFCQVHSGRPDDSEMCTLFGDVGSAIVNGRECNVNRSG